MACSFIGSGQWADISYGTALAYCPSEANELWRNTKLRGHLKMRPGCCGTFWCPVAVGPFDGLHWMRHTSHSAFSAMQSLSGDGTNKLNGTCWNFVIVVYGEWIKLRKFQLFIGCYSCSRSTCWSCEPRLLGICEIFKINRNFISVHLCLYSIIYIWHLWPKCSFCSAIILFATEQSSSYVALANSASHSAWISNFLVQGTLCWCRINASFAQF